MSDYLRQAKELCPEDMRLAAIECVADALEAAHKRGRVAGLREAERIVYRDIVNPKVVIAERIRRRAEEVERAQRLLDTAAGPVFTTQTKPDPSKGVEKS